MGGANGSVIEIELKPMGFLTQPRTCRCSCVSLQPYKCHFRVLFYFGMTDGGAYVYVYITPATVQYTLMFLPATPPLRKGLTRDDPDRRGYTQGYQTD